MSAVRTIIDVDDALIAEAMVRTGLTTQKAVIEAALRCLLQTKRQQGLRELRGKVKWEGDLDAMRRSRHPEWS